MQKNTLTSITMLTGISENEFNSLTEEAQNELESAYTVNSGILGADEISAELKRLYVHHVTDSILSGLAERFSLNPDTLKNLPQSARSEILIQYENYNSYNEMYHIIQKCIQGYCKRHGCHQFDAIDLLRCAFRTVEKTGCRYCL